MDSNDNEPVAGPAGNHLTSERERMLDAAATDYDPAILAAARRYIALRDRAQHPGGTFDRAGRFHLACYHACCGGIRDPSRAHPYSEMVHARTLPHVLHETGLVTRAAEVRACLRVIDPRVAERRARRMRVVENLRAEVVRDYERAVREEGGCPTLLVAAEQLCEELKAVRSVPRLREMIADFGVDDYVAWMDQRPRRRGRSSGVLQVVLRLWRAGKDEREAMAWRAVA